MTKPKTESKQLQLRLLAEVGAVASRVTAVSTPPAVVVRDSVNLATPASESDMTVYRGISDNYFRSLRKD